MALYKRNKLVKGVGVNDSDYNVYTYIIIEGKRKVTWKCPFFSRWNSLLDRCYNIKRLKNHPAYAGCSVCNEWLTFSKFKAWMELQDWPEPRTEFEDQDDFESCVEDYVEEISSVLRRNNFISNFQQSF